jgi:hypothetical protein
MVIPDWFSMGLFAGFALRWRSILSSEGAGLISIPALLCRIDDKDPASTVLRAWARACYIDLPIRYWCRARRVFILRRSA